MKPLFYKAILSLAIGLSFSTTANEITHYDISPDGAKVEIIYPKYAWWNEYKNNEGFEEALIEIGTSIDDLNHNIDKSVARGENVNDALFWLKRSFEIYPVQNKNKYNIPVTEIHEQGRNRTGAHGRNSYFLTRDFVAKGQSIKLMVGEIPAGVACSIATGVNFDQKDLMPDAQTLIGSSVNTYQSNEEGTILIGCTDEDIQMPNVDKFINIEILEGGTKQSFFIFGQSSQADWRTLSQSNAKSGQIFMFTGRSRMNVKMATAKKSTDTNMVHSMSQYLTMTINDDIINGFDGSGALNQPSRGLIVATYNDCCFADGGQGFTAIGFNSTLKDNTDWGDWHEFGHHNQQGWSWSALTEVTVNLYAIANCTLFRGETPDPVCHTNSNIKALDWSAYSVGNFITSGEHYNFDSSGSNTEFKRATLFAQLLFSYPELYPQLGKAFREEYNYAKNRSKFDSSQELKDWFVVNTSKYSKNDLREFYDHWGLTYSSQASDTVNAMKLPKPYQPAQTQEITLNSDYSSAFTDTSMVDPIAKNMGYVLPTADQGPASLVWVEAGDSQFYVDVTDNQQRAFRVKLHGKKSVGMCGNNTLNSTQNCVSGSTNFIRIDYRKEDNTALPVGTYHGTAHILGRDWYKSSWASEIKLNLNIVK